MRKFSSSSPSLFQFAEKATSRTIQFPRRSRSRFSTVPFIASNSNKRPNYVTAEAFIRFPIACSCVYVPSYRWRGHDLPIRLAGVTNCCLPKRISICSTIDAGHLITDNGGLLTTSLPSASDGTCLPLLCHHHNANPELTHSLRIIFHAAFIRDFLGVDG